MLKLLSLPSLCMFFLTFFWNLILLLVFDEFLGDHYCDGRMQYLLGIAGLFSALIVISRMILPFKEMVPSIYLKGKHITYYIC